MKRITRRQQSTCGSRPFGAFETIPGLVKQPSAICGLADIVHHHVRRTCGRLRHRPGEKSNRCNSCSEISACRRPTGIWAANSDYGMPLNDNLGLESQAGSVYQGRLHATCSVHCPHGANAHVPCIAPKSLISHPNSGSGDVVFCKQIRRLPTGKGLRVSHIVQKLLY